MSTRGGASSTDSPRRLPDVPTTTRLALGRASPTDQPTSVADLPKPPLSVRPHVGRDGGWRTWVPLTFVMLALSALVVLPMLGDRYTRPLHAEIRQLTEPGRTLVTRIHLALAIQGPVLRDYLENREAPLVGRYREAVEQERQAYADLAPIATRLGGAVQQRFSALLLLQADWHTAVDEFLKQGASPTAIVDPLRQNLYDDLLLAAALLDEEINNAAQASRARILAAERAQQHVTFALGVVALIAVMVVASLGRQLRLFASAAERRRVELERATESRARLMRGVSHDLKNPLNAIDGHAQLLEEEVMGTLLPRQKDSIVRIRRAVRSLLALINDLLELSRAEAGQLKMAPRSLDIGALVREVSEEHRAAAEAVGHQVDILIATGMPSIITDPERVRQVLGNLLSNAVKYTPPGGRIGVTVEASSRDGRAGTSIEVADSGSGIPPDKLDAIFDEFSRLEVHEHKPGVGLGLAIARRVADLLGGDLTVASELGRGSFFTLWLPDERRNGS